MSTSNELQSYNIYSELLLKLYEDRNNIEKLSNFPMEDFINPLKKINDDISNFYIEKIKSQVLYYFKDYYRNMVYKNIHNKSFNIDECVKKIAEYKHGYLQDYYSKEIKNIYIYNQL